MIKKSPIAFLMQHRLWLIFGAAYVLLIFYALAAMLQNSQLGDHYYRATFEGMVNGTAHRPFVYRILMPRLTNLVTEVTPMAVQQSLNEAVDAYLQDRENTGLRRIIPSLDRVFPSPGHIYPRLVMIGLMFGCLWGFALMLYKLAAQLYPTDAAIRYFAPIFGLLLIPTFNWRTLYIYDPAVLFLSTACYYFMAVRRFELYIAFFAFACLNKESSFFIMLFFALWFFSRLERKHYLLLCAAQVIIFVAIRTLIVWSYDTNPGGVFEEHLGRMVKFELYPKGMYHRLLGLLTLIFMLTFEWQKKPVFLKYFFFVFPPFYVAYFLYGWPGEYRVFFDILPLAVLLATHTVIASTGLSASRFFQPDYLKEHDR